MTARAASHAEPALTPHGVPGRLDCDELAGGLLCHVCGRHFRSLAQHARLAHALTAAAYRERAGLNRQTRLMTPALRERLREVTAPLIARLRADGRLRRWDEDPERWQRGKAAAVAALQDGLRAEGRRHRREAVTDQLRQGKAAQRRARNLAGLDKASGAAIAAGVRRAAGVGACDRCGQGYQRTQPRARYCPACRVLVQREQGRESRRRARLR